MDNDAGPLQTPQSLLAEVTNPSLTPLERLVRLMQILRSEAGCSWDRAQTHQSLIPYLVEEAYETIDAISSGDPVALRGELGDLLCQIVFHAQLADEAGQFTMEQVVSELTQKLIHRHPHVFGETADLTPQQVRDQWERQKKQHDPTRSILGGIPASMPALTMAFRIGEKAGGVGFDWPSATDVLAKVREETNEVADELGREPINRDRLESEIGDLLQAVASLARKLSIDPEQALKRSLATFRARFARLEAVVSSEGKEISSMTADELELVWQRVKQTERM